MNLMNQKNSPFSLGAWLAALALTFTMCASSALADEGEDDGEDDGNKVAEYSSSTTWETVSDSSSLVVSGNCISFTVAQSHESTLENYENEMKQSENTKKSESNQENEEDDGIENITNEVDAENVDNNLPGHESEENMDNNLSNVDNDDDHHLENFNNDTNSVNDDDVEEHNSSKSEHNSSKDSHQTISEHYTSSQIPTGTTACKTPGGDLGFLPSSAAGSKGSPTKKALRELFGK